MGQVSFTAADNVTISVPSGLTAGEDHLLWSSTEITQGNQHNSCSVKITYHELLPDPNTFTPFDHELIMIVEEKQDDGSWEEVGRQNQPIRNHTSQAPQRQVLVSPSVNAEEGLDFAIAGFNGIEVKLKSLFRDATDGNPIRICLVLRENQPDTTNALDSVRFSIHGKRFDG